VLERRNTLILKKIKLSILPQELIPFYDAYCKERNIKMGTEQAHKIWWAMFYCAKEGKEWIL